jgi:hypothetical protein
MAKQKNTTSTARRATAAKATKAFPVQWGRDDKGRAIVTSVCGHWAHDLPAAHWRGLRDTINDMGEVVDAFNAFGDMRGSATADQRLTMLSMCATVARTLMLQAAEDMGGVLALSPRLRSVLAKGDALMASRGGAQ